MPETTSVREHESWWWVHPTAPGAPTSSVGVGNRPELVKRAARIYGGHVEVVRQTITTVVRTERVDA